jgi:hypothetical protein
MAQLSNKLFNFSVFQLRHIAWLLLTTALLVVSVTRWAYYPREEVSKTPVEETSETPATVDSGTVLSCMDRYGTKKELQIADLQLVRGVYQICYDVISTELLSKEQIIRNDNFLFQRSENIVLMYMVVAITVSGVILAGLQLLASYKLALLGKGSLPDGGTVDVTAHSIALKSSVVGVVILGISFAFFLVFVLYVYTLKDAGTQGSSQQTSQTDETSPPRARTPLEQANIGKAVPRQTSPTAAPQPRTPLEQGNIGKAVSPQTNAATAPK